MEKQNNKVLYSDMILVYIYSCPGGRYNTGITTGSILSSYKSSIGTEKYKGAKIQTYQVPIAEIINTDQFCWQMRLIIVYV